MKKQKLFKRTPMLLLLILSTVVTRAQEVALKTNLLGLATTSLKGDLVTAEKHLAKAGNSKEAERIRKIYEEMKAEQ